MIPTLPSMPARMFALSLLGCVGLAASSAQAQTSADYTATKSLSLSAFAGYSRVSPDYGQSANHGFVAGGDFTRHYRLFDPSLEIRFGYSTGPVVSQNYLTAGLKAEKVYGHFHPYADFELGHANINFQTPIQFSTGPYSHDDSVVFLFGGGLDYDLNSHYALKLDVQSQSWKLGSASNRLTPTTASVGVVYRFEFSQFKHHR